MRDIEQSTDCEYSDEDASCDKELFIVTDYSAKGRWLTGTFEVDSKFDLQKLKVICRTLIFDPDYPYGPFVTAIEYDGKLVTDPAGDFCYTEKTAELLG